MMAIFAAEATSLGIWAGFLVLGVGAGLFSLGAVIGSEHRSPLERVRIRRVWRQALRDDRRPVCPRTIRRPEAGGSRPVVVR